MTLQIAELTGVFVIIIGCGVIVGAAAMVSVALAVLVSGVLLVFAGILAVYVANQLAARAKAEAKTP